MSQPKGANRRANDHHGTELFVEPSRTPRGFLNFGLTSERNYDVMPDGRILGVVPETAATPSAGSTPQQFQVVLNWFEELKQRVPATR